MASLIIGILLPSINSLTGFLSVSILILKCTSGLLVLFQYGNSFFMEPTIKKLFERIKSGPFFRFLLWWGGLFAFLGGTTTCPCCGQPICATSAAGAGIIAGVCSLVFSMFRWLKKQPDPSSPPSLDHNK
jgi:hypothetical protein